MPELDQVRELLEACIRLNTDNSNPYPVIYNLSNPTVTFGEPRLFYVKLDSSDVVIRLMSGMLSICINDDARAAGQSVITEPNAIAEFGLDIATLKKQVVNESPRNE